MTDPAFIESILQRGREAKDKVSLEFSHISFKQINWKPSLKSWSIAQCLDHLIASHNAYFPHLEKIIEGRYKMNFWERHSPFTSVCGKILKDQMQEQVKKKLRAPKKIGPSNSEIKIDIIQGYYKNLDVFLRNVSNCIPVDLDRTVIPSPIMRFVTYTLRDALFFLVEHEHRHINQAIRVKRNEGFPKGQPSQSHPIS
jgi:uncharacterized damage-inducible protein DinB